MFILRLDDASEYMDIKKWDMIEKILDKYHIKPIIGVIPDNNDESLINSYDKDNYFWDKVRNWQNKGWTIALHGYQHKFVTKSGGINPVNMYSEFAGLSYEKQSDKLKFGNKLMLDQGINASVFIAPAHTFDMNTLKALKSTTNIRVISDTVANDIYYKNGFYFIPQQTGKLRNLPFKLVTSCYHPNLMCDSDINELENFIIKNRSKFLSVGELDFRKRRYNAYDKFLRCLYFSLRRLHGS